MMPTATIFKRLRSAVAAVVCALVVTACGGGGGSGGGNTENPVPPGSSNTSSFTYSGPAPSSAEVQRFQQAFYNNLAGDNRCGSCHTRGGAGKIAFVDHGDVNYAYQQALTLVNFDNPAASKIVERVYSGHNCWESSTAACRVQMISFIQNWANSGGAGATTVKLSAPTDRDPNGADINGDGKGDGFRSFPDLATYSASQLYQFVSNPIYCARCHSDTSAVKQKPYFGSSTPSVSYDAIQGKVDLNDPSLFSGDPSGYLQGKSRLVVRLRDEYHNCWSSSCAKDAATMQGMIAQLAQNSPLHVLDPSVYRSMAQVLDDGVVGNSSGRFEQYQIALWRFNEGEGNVISDTSGVSPEISLTIKGTEGPTGDYQWIGGGGIQFNGAVAYDASGASKKLYDLISASGAYSIEAWTLPANVADKDRDIVAYSDGTDHRNFMLGQTQADYDFYNRSSATDPFGMVGGDKFSSDPAKTAAQASLQHVVLTYDAVDGRKIYVDGELVSQDYPDDKGTLAGDWNSSYEIVLGNTLGGGAPWKGALRMVAIHDRALTLAEIRQNYGVPPGEKRYVMFDVSQIPNMPASCRGTDASGNAVNYCYVYFEVSQYDNYAYLFTDPHFISLNSDVSDLNGLEIKGIHIGINGQLSPVGQAYVHVDAKIGVTGVYVAGDTPGSGQALVDPQQGAEGTIVPKLAGADSDLLYLEFDKIGKNADQPPATNVLPFAYTLDGAAAIDLGWRTFDALNETFYQLTDKVPLSASTVVVADAGATPPTVGEVFDSLRAQLPAVGDFPSYLASHQTAVTQLAIAYCSALMWNTNLRDQFFGTSTNDTPAAFRADWKNNLIDPMVTKFMSGGALLSEPTTTDVSTELLNLITYPGDANRSAGLCANNVCSSDDTRTLNAATAACAAGLANAAITLK